MKMTGRERHGQLNEATRGKQKAIPEKKQEKYVPENLSTRTIKRTFFPELFSEKRFYPPMAQNSQR